VDEDLDEVDLVVSNFEDEYGGDWGRLWKRVEGLKRTVEVKERKKWQYTYESATTKVHLIVNDERCTVLGVHVFEWSLNVWKLTAPHVSEVLESAFQSCANLTEVNLPCVNRVGEYVFFSCRKLRKITIPNAISIGRGAFRDCYALRHITLPPSVKVKKYAFYSCLSLHALAASTNLEVVSDNETDTELLTRYLLWRNENDRQREQFHAIKLMLKLCNWHTDKKTGVVRCEVEKQDCLANFLFQNEDPVKHILSFFGEKKGGGNLRELTKYELHAVALEVGAPYGDHWWWSNATP